MTGPTRLHHVAFAARDVEATYDFYARRLGMKLVHVENHRAEKGWFRHFFFDMGGGESLGFFAFENIGEKAGWRSDISTGVGLPIWVNHLAFNVDGLDALDAMRRRCNENGVELLMDIDHGWCRSIYMVDPNGIMVEFTTSTSTGGFEQPEDVALALLRLPPSEFPAEERKDASSGNVQVNEQAMRRIATRDPRQA